MKGEGKKRLTAQRKLELYLETRQKDANLGEILRRHGLHLNNLRRIEAVVIRAALEALKVRRNGNGPAASARKKLCRQGSGLRMAPGALGTSPCRQECKLVLKEKLKPFKERSLHPRWMNFAGTSRCYQPARNWRTSVVGSSVTGV